MPTSRLNLSVPPLRQLWPTGTRDHLTNACKSFRSCIKAVSHAEGGWIAQGMHLRVVSTRA